MALRSLRSQLECRRNKTSVIKSYMLSIFYRNPETPIAECFDLFFRLLRLLNRAVQAG